MKRINIWLGVIALALVGSGCNSFLDELPDKRSDISDPKNLQRLVTSAYPLTVANAILEGRTDNVADNGSGQPDDNRLLYENYRWMPVSSNNWDTPEVFWNNAYSAISAANEALAQLESQGNPTELNHIRGEALLCRAYAEHELLRVFAKAYNTQTSATDLGVPYWTQPERRVFEPIKRKSVKECYELIDKDIQEGINLIDDSKFQNGTKIYHFNTKAAAAFAAQFYLYYEQWDKAKEYATRAIGEDPTASLFDINRLSKTVTITSMAEVGAAINTDSEPSNLMLQAVDTRWPRTLYGDWRYAHTLAISRNETLQSRGPWGGNFAVSSITIGYSSMPEVLQIWRKYDLRFKITNVSAGTGYPKMVVRVFTVDRALLIRAEANVMLKDYASAARDLSYYYAKNNGKVMTADAIAAYYDVSDASTLSQEDKANRIKYLSKPLHPKFAIEAGLQTNLLYAVLHARRIDNLFDGLRWDDIKRYGIEVTHQTAAGETLVLTSDDPRHAVQLPSKVTSGDDALEKNPE